MGSVLMLSRGGEWEESPIEYGGVSQKHLMLSEGEEWEESHVE